MNTVSISEKQIAVLRTQLPLLYKRMKVETVLELTGDLSVSGPLLLGEAPLEKYDLVLLRDALGHFSERDIYYALRKIYASGSRFLLSTTFPKVKERVDIRTGGWRPINLEHYNRKHAMLYVDEGALDSEGRNIGKQMGLYRVN